MKKQGEGVPAFTIRALPSSSQKGGPDREEFLRDISAMLISCDEDLRQEEWRRNHYDGLKTEAEKKIARLERMKAKLLRVRRMLENNVLHIC
jgi:hypothetical protein